MEDGIRGFTVRRDKYVRPDEDGVYEDLEMRLREILEPTSEEEAAFRECLEAALETHRMEVPDDLEPSILSPAFFGLLTSSLLAHSNISRGTKLKACLEVFDAIPLPDREDEAFLTEETVPPGFQEAARFLWHQGEFVEYHLLHLIYALYLDPRLAASGRPSILKENLLFVLAEDFPVNLKLLYAYLLLSSPVLEAEVSRDLLSVLLEAPRLSRDAKRSLCGAALDRAAGMEWIVQIAAKEGLYPPAGSNQEEVLREVRVRPLPPSLSSMAEAWLRAHGEPGKP
ncbi:MAG: hypothetical protein ACE5HJ_00565 [Thermoplasmata archaeon]